MTREQLETRIRSAVSRFARTIADSSSVPLGLVEELVLIANHHAITSAAESVERPAADDLGRPLTPDGTVIPETPQATERRAARVRGDTTPRRAAARQ